MIDPYATLYFSLSPYHYGGNSPVNTIDVDGRLFIFVNGFMLDHYKKGSNSTPYIPTDDVGYFQRPSHLTYMPDRNFHSDGPRNAGQAFEYWGQMAVGFQNAFPSEKQLFTNGSFTPKSTANARFQEGIAVGQNLIKMLESDVLTLADGETIKIVGHSHGAAMAAGIATVLAKNPKNKHFIEFVLYFSPQQPGDFTHPDDISGYQFSTMSDWVSSTGRVARWLNSDYQLIEGARWGIERESHKGGRSGHSIDTWVEDWRRFAKENNIPFTVY